jgi:hypothetical protein
VSAETRERTVGSERDATGEVRDQGTCFGYLVRSSLPFLALRSGDGTPLDVTDDAPDLQRVQEVPLLHWFDEAGNEIAEVHAGNGAYDVRIEELGWFHVDPSVPSVAVPPVGDELRREARLWGIPAVLCFLQRGDLPLHAAAVDVDGSALVLAAPGRFGKTTLAGAFLREGHRVLSEDVSCCTLDPGPAVFPGPALLRIRRDMYQQLEFPDTEVVGEDPERIYLTVQGSARGDGSPVPIRGVVFLRRSEDESTALERLPRESAVPDLWALSLNLPTDESRAQCFRGVTSLAAEVPVWNLHRRLKVERLAETVDRIISTCLP